MKQQRKSLNFSKLKFSGKFISSKEALKDVTPMKWSKDVLEGKKEVIVSHTKREEK